MSREIKFREYDQVINAFFYYSVGAGCTCYVDENSPQHSEDKDRGYPEQFTGETDEFGVDIYENDIVKLYWENKNWLQVVEFDSGGFYPFTDTCGQYSHPWEVCALAHGNYEVIGNIHEHKHLLED